MTTGMYLRSVRQTLAGACRAGWLASAAVTAAAAPPLADLTGSGFSGGAQSHFGAIQFGERQVNYVYAKPTQAAASMAAGFALITLPPEPQFLHLRACNQDVGGQCRVEITLNGTLLFSAANPFPAARFQWERFALPEGIMKLGKNELRITNIEEQGALGQPPWFMVARAVIGSRDQPLEQRPRLEQDFYVDLPAAAAPLPTPLAAGREPGFRLRGSKGWMWLPEQYQAELPTLAAGGGNFLMICYGSMWNLEDYPEWPEQNAWWLPLPEKKRQAYLDLLRACQSRQVELCLSLNPNLSSSRPLAYGSTPDLDALWQHYAVFQSAGMKWFSVCLDDISQGIDAGGQAKVVNAIFGRLRAQDGSANLIFCPTLYWGDGSGESAGYLETLARELHPDILLFWTGDAVVTPRITREAAEAYRERSRHRLVIWDNYPVNDGNPTLHLGPLTGRAPDLGEVCEGYMSNPMKTESEINRLPLLTCLDYAYNPWDYDPGRSVGQAILRLGSSAEQRRVLKDLVELFPGMLIHGKGTGFNPVVDRFAGLLDTPHSRHLADLYLSHVETVSTRLQTAFPERFAPTLETLRQTTKALAAMRQAAYGAPP